MMHFCFILLFLLTSSLQPLRASGSQEVVGEQLYASEEKLPDAAGSLSLLFSTANPNRVVIAWGHKYRKNQFSRSNTSEAWRERIKPRRAKISPDGRTAVFSKLPPDYYDILVFCPDSRMLYEGLTLLPDDESHPLPQEILADISEKLLGKREKNTDVSVWEGFFDTKQLDRGVSSGSASADSPQNAVILLQQKRLGRALAESGRKLEGHVHSVDVVWLIKARGTAGWQVPQRQQLYRAELPFTEFFQTVFSPALSAIRIGAKERKISLEW